MASTQLALVLIGTTLAAITLFVWATLYYVPQILYGDDHEHDDGRDTHVDAGRPS